MELKLDENDATAREIARVIADPDSPVGIDAKTTHILIIKKLLDIEARLEALERASPK